MSDSSYVRKRISLENLWKQGDVNKIKKECQIIFQNEKICRKEKLFLYACQKGNLTLVKLFVKYKFGIDQIDEKNGFLYACEFGKLEIVKFLFAKNCGINQIDWCGKNGFLYACQKGYFKIIKFLFEQNCGINQIDKNEQNGFMLVSLVILKLWNFYLKKSVE